MRDYLIIACKDSTYIFNVFRSSRCQSCRMNYFYLTVEEDLNVICYYLIDLLITLVCFDLYCATKVSKHFLKKCYIELEWL